MRDRRVPDAPPGRALGVVWVLVALVVAALGTLVFGLAEQRGDRVVGAVLLAAAVAGLVAAAGVLARTRRALLLSRTASALVVLAGLVALFGLSGNALSDRLLFGGLPVLGGVLTALVAGLSPGASTRARRT